VPAPRHRPGWRHRSGSPPADSSRPSRARSPAGRERGRRPRVAAQPSGAARPAASGACSPPRPTSTPSTSGTRATAPRHCRTSIVGSGFTWATPHALRQTAIMLAHAGWGSAPPHRGPGGALQPRHDRPGLPGPGLHGSSPVGGRPSRLSAALPTRPRSVGNSVGDAARRGGGRTGHPQAKDLWARPAGIEPATKCLEAVWVETLR
jgi:hypothetical protein